MPSSETWLAGAAAVQLLIASANFVAPSLLGYRENLARLSPIVRQIFRVHSAYIVIVVLGCAALCLAFPAELAGGSALGRSLSAFLAGFWGLRLVIQLRYYDAEVRRQHRLASALFATAFAYLTLVFALAATRQW